MKVEEGDKLIAERLRVLVRTTISSAEETIRQGRITYTLGGKDFAGIRLANGHVDLLFLAGSSLSSPRLRGQGTTDDPKHLEVYSLRNFDETEAKRLLTDAAAIVA